MLLQEVQLLLHLLAGGAAVDVGSGETPKALGSRATLARNVSLLEGLERRGLVRLRREVVRYRAAGGAEAPETVPAAALDPVRRRILQNCATRDCSPTQAVAGCHLAGPLRDQALESLLRAGLLQAAATRTLAEVTSAGRQWLLWEWDPGQVGNRQKLGLGYLRTYLQLWREQAQPRPEAPPQLPASAAAPPVAEAPTHAGPAPEPGPPPGVDEVLAAIVQLDRQHGLANRVPLYLLRERLSAQLSRVRLDRLLFELVDAGRLRLNPLQEAHRVTPEQYTAGIPSPSGGPRFYLVVLDHTAVAPGATARSHQPLRRP